MAVQAAEEAKAATTVAKAAAAAATALRGEEDDDEEGTGESRSPRRHRHISQSPVRLHGRCSQHGSPHIHQVIKESHGPGGHARGRCSPRRTTTSEVW